MTKKDILTTTIIGIFLMVFFFWSLNSTKEKYYKEKYNRTIEATVSTKENKIIVFTDSAGNSWEWELEENENYKNQQKVLLVFNTKGTENIEDDILIQINKRK